MRILIPYLATHVLRPFHRFFPDLLWRVEAEARTAYLTFDDGPTPECTRPLLDVMVEYDAQATHFLLGEHAEQHPNLVQAITAAGHRVGNHSYNHPDPWSTPRDELAQQFSRTTQILEDLVRPPIRSLRPPYGHPTPFLREWCAAHNQRMVMWDVMPGDYLKTATPSRVSSFVINHIRPGSVVVLHDNPICEHVTPQALETILDTLTAKGWQFDAL